MKKIVIGCPVLLLFLFQLAAPAQTVSRHIKTKEYKQLQDSLCNGWNTWYNGSFIAQVHLPEAFSIQLCLARPGDADYLSQTFKTAAIQNRPETLVPGIRSDDGSYTSVMIKYKGDSLNVESAVEENEVNILVTPLGKTKNILVVEAAIPWNRQGNIGAANNQLFGRFGQHTITVQATAQTTPDAYAASTAPHLSFALDAALGIYSGKAKSLEQIKSIISRHRAVQQKRISSYGNLSASFSAMQTILAWNTIYDAPNHRVITPVSRNWSNGWGGFVLFDWDTYFASYMLSQFNKNLAYANAIEITKAITPSGFIPNYEAPFRNSSWDRSQPPIGSSIILWMYNRYKEKWLLEEVYDELLSWNRWWPKNRDMNGFLCWGSDPIPDSLRKMEGGEDLFNLNAAKLESGLDNSPMYDSLTFNPTKHVMQLADVGLMSMYILDCHSMEAIARILGKNKEAAEIAERAAFYSKQLKTLWDDKAGIFLNKRLDSNISSNRLSPTNFYPLLANVCTDEQVARMMKEHYFNPKEFYGDYVIPSISRNDPAFADNDYWRGRIWGPMNFLVYMGMKNYPAADSGRKDLVEKSKRLLMKNLEKDGGVYENYNSVTGEAGDVNSADGFYHWGALLTFIGLMENGYMK